MKTLNTLNSKLNSNDKKALALKTDNNSIVSEAITMVSDKIASIVNNEDYKASERKAIKVIKVDMFKPKNKEDKINTKLNNAIKAVVTSHKRKVFDFIDWDMSVSKINEMLLHLTVKEIKDNKDLESINDLLNSKKTRTVSSLAYPKAAKQ